MHRNAFIRTAVAAAVAFTSLISGEILAGSQICPVAFMGIWNGRHQYYCFSGMPGNPCAGTPVSGSSVGAHSLGCSGTTPNITCIAPIGPAADGGTANEQHDLDPERPFEGAKENELYPIQKPNASHVLTHFVVKIRVGQVVKNCTVALVVHDDVKITACCGHSNPVPLVISQEVNPKIAVTPINNEPIPATAYDNKNGVVTFNILTKTFFDSTWLVNEDQSIKPWYNTIGSTKVVAVVIP